MGYKCVYMLSEIQEYLKNTVLFAFDFETSPRDKWRNDKSVALDAHKADITGISFSVSEGTAIYVPLKHRSGRNAENQAAIWDYLKLLFESKDVIKVAHNLAFESMFLYARGIVLQKPCYDTIAADSGLKTLAPALCKAEMTEFSTVTEGRFFDELNPQDEKTVRYACADSDYTLRLYHVFNQWFDRFLPKHRTIVEEVESPTSVYVGIMKYNGILVDKSAMLKKQAEAAEKIVSIRKEIAGIIGNVEIGANASTSAFKKYLFVDLGLPVMKTTAKHQEAADDETMILLKGWCESNRPELSRLFELVQEYRKWGKLKSTYIDGYLRFIDGDTGRIHPDLIPLGTETGRFASRNPNMQNCPQKDNDPIGVRKFIIAPAGKVLLSLDFSQIELRVGAFYCRDKRMLETYRTGGDIHAQTTSVIYRIPFEEAADKNAPHYKERRTIAKNCNFGVFYGLFPTGLQRTLKFKAGINPTLAECETIIQNLKSGYPGLAKWQDEVKKRAAVSCYSETWLGRRRYLLGIRSSDWGKKSFAERCALNTPIQGTAADILKLACGRIISGLPERLWLKPMLQIHDELVFELPEDKVDEAVVFIKECMETQPFPAFDVPIVAEASVGRNFGEMKEMED
ncbi:bifunctional 3'-5' exonuclease/DNA polymerase [Tepidanaerobacter sp. GT38]|uniref:bifunctional 3'-5' exonuclease/DNA polymerase n=1 Tax=Tepidanaerobacter sp. GT38 TaxID=2722793 RepID=UPI001F45A7BF|nr:bifunctional 3'-5' exonuclease/DNA polymerase [Tepidanaerobacter sp. GT38]MCG1011163.1 bifunctional 3'-5' exonuclease/DNA polymerase [Tepidanaerobacter sp. GT38]